MNLAFEEHGCGFPFVLIHAFPLSRKMWSENVETIVDNGFRLILPDLPGFGQSELLPQVNSIEAAATAINDLLDFLKIEKAVIGGLSMGGYVTFNLYRLYPQKFAGLVLCDTNPGSDAPEKRQQRRGLIGEIEKRGVDVLIEKMLPDLIGGFTKKSNLKLIERLENMFAEANPKTVISALRAMSERKDQTNILEKINVPTVLIFGEDDQITNLETARKMSEKIRNSRLRTIKNAGHYSNMEQPQEFNRIIENFIKELKI